MPKQIFKALLPPIISSLGGRCLRAVIRRPLDGFYGNYSSFTEALTVANNSGYQSQYIIDRVVENAVVSLQSKADGKWPVFINSIVNYTTAPLFHCYSQQAQIGSSLKFRVLDFGGAVGGYYNHLESLFPSPTNVEWTVCETPLMASKCREAFPQSPIQFIDTLPTIGPRGENKFHCVLASGAIQYTENPTETLSALLKLTDSLILNRIPFFSSTKDRLVMQYVHPKLYGRGISYPMWFLSEDYYLDLIQKAGFKIKLRWKVPEDTMSLDDKVIVAQGLYAQRSI